MNSVPATELRRRTLWSAYAIGGFGLGMSNMILFLVPLRARELGADFEAVGLIVAAAALAPAICSIPLGTVIDRVGARRAFVIGTSSCAAVAVAATLITHYWWLVPLQFLFGVARTLGWVASQSYITTLGQVQDRATLTGRFTFFSNVGTTVGPLAAGAAAQMIGFRLAFLFLAFYATAFAIGGLLLERTPPLPRTASSPGGAGFRTAFALLGLRGMQIALLLTFARLWVSWVWTAFYPVYLVEAGLAAGVVGTVIAARGLTAMAVAPTAGYWARLASKETVATVGLGIGAAGLLAGPHLTTVPFVYLASASVGVAAGLSLPMLIAIVSDVAPDGQRGVALGLRQSVNNMASAAAPSLVGPLIAGFGMTVAFGFGGGIAAVVLVAASLRRWRPGDKET